MLEINKVQKNFGGLTAVNNATMQIEKGSITGLIGPNGAGKTTLFNVITGNLQSDSGEVFLNGEKISGLKSHELFYKGVLRTFQIAHEFTSLTVLENLMMVPGNQFGENLLYSWFKNSVVRKQEEQIRAKAVEVINFLNLTHLTQELAGNLSGGQKKLLELGRTMMVDAKLVLLDEVGAGVNRTLLNEISDAIIRLNKEKDYTFFVIEHDMDLIEKICDPVIVMAEGGVLFQGSFDEVKSNDEVIEAYLGRGMKKGSIKFMIFFKGENISAGYGGADIIKNCNIQVEEGEIVVLIGPNGAGKSTVMKAMLGMLNLRKGSVKFNNDDITAMLPQDRVNLGIAFVPQTKNVFTGMTVEENLEMGAFLRNDNIQDTINQVYDLFPILSEKRKQYVGELSGGQRQQVAFGRALMTKPSILMLDEPTAGVSPIVMDDLFTRIIEVGKTGVGILMVEQNAKQALSIANRGYVMVNGENRMEGSGEDLLNNPNVRKSFLGG